MDPCVDVHTVSFWFLQNSTTHSYFLLVLIYRFKPNSSTWRSLSTTLPWTSSSFNSWAVDFNEHDSFPPSIFAYFNFLRLSFSYKWFIFLVFTSFQKNNFFSINQFWNIFTKCSVEHQILFVWFLHVLSWY